MPRRFREDLPPLDGEQNKLIVDKNLYDQIHVKPPRAPRLMESEPMTDFEKDF